MTERVAQKSLTSGDHGTTYGGNPLACAAANKVLELYEQQNVLENVRRVAPYLEKKLLELMERHSCIREHRGIGLMQGLLFEQPVGPIINRAIEKGLLLINAGPNIIRFVPPLIITEQDVDRMIEILERCIEE